jgi:hypothetical protein
MSFPSWLRSWKSLLIPRNGAVRSPQRRHRRNGPGLAIRPCLEALEDRALPSAPAFNVPAGAGTAGALSRPGGDDHAQPFKESLTVPHVSDGVYTYVGHATLLGRVTGFSFPDGSFTQVAADGDQLFGQLHATTGTTGSVTFAGGTGEFAHASGSASYTIWADPKTGIMHVDVIGTLSGEEGDKGDRDGKALPFAITGGGTAPQGIALAPFVLAPHPTAGTASYLGHYTGLGMFEHDPLVIDPTSGKVTANFQGECTFVAANGDKLVTHYGTGYTGKMVGQLSADGTAVQGVQFDAIFTIDGAQSTGQFAGASGSWRMIAHAENVPLAGTIPGHTAPFNYTWTGGGTITFAHGDR